MSTKTAIVLANFGGPRKLSEIRSFLTELLTDVDVIRTPLPRFIEKWFFKKVAERRVTKIAKDYELIGGKSPLYDDTEQLAKILQQKTALPLITFHRYLPATHAQFFDAITTHEAGRFVVLPMYPQFSYSTTGSVARFFDTHLPPEVVQKMEWVRSYAMHPAYIKSMQQCIRDFLQEKQIDEREAFLFFSGHGLPQEFVDQGDPYQRECQFSYEAIMKEFHQVPSLLAFQSKFGPGEWLKPYTSELSKTPFKWIDKQKHVVFIPLTFTSDHLETLYEVEYTYLPEIRAKGFFAHRCPALNHRHDWIDALTQLIHTAAVGNQELIRV